MMNKLLIASSLALLNGVLPASAEWRLDNVRMVPEPLGLNQPQSTITANFSVTDTVPLGAAPGDIAAAMAREITVLTDIINRQCAVLQDTMKRPCKMVRMNLNSNAIDQHNATGIVVNANGNVTFEFGTPGNGAAGQDAATPPGQAK